MHPSGHPRASHPAIRWNVKFLGGRGWGHGPGLADFWAVVDVVVVQTHKHTLTHPPACNFSSRFHWASPLRSTRMAVYLLYPRTAPPSRPVMDCVMAARCDDVDRSPHPATKQKHPHPANEQKINQNRIRHRQRHRQAGCRYITLRRMCAIWPRDVLLQNAVIHQTTQQNPNRTANASVTIAHTHDHRYSSIFIFIFILPLSPGPGARAKQRQSHKHTHARQFHMRTVAGEFTQLRARFSCSYSPRT